jgi:hypothetical protein
MAVQTVDFRSEIVLYVIRGEGIDSLSPRVQRVTSDISGITVQAAVVNCTGGYAIAVGSFEAVAVPQSARIPHRAFKLEYWFDDSAIICK